MRTRSSVPASKLVQASALAAQMILLVAGPALAQPAPPINGGPPPSQPLPKGTVPFVPLLTPEQRLAMVAELSGKEALRHAERLARYHRLAPSPDLDRAMRYIARQLTSAGFDAVETTTYKSDGAATWWVEPAPPAWTCDAAELWIEEPDRWQLADWAAQPIRVAAYSTSCDVTADIEEVTGLESDVDLKGKIVLARGDARTLHRMAVEHGALGLLLAPPHEMKGEAMGGIVAASSLSPATKDWKTNRFAFNISADEAAAIRASLNTGKPVRARAVIKNARTSPSKCPIVSATLRPRSHSKERVILIAQVAGPKPGANSASGAAALLGLARTYKKLIEDEVLLPPSRAVEFLFVPDVHGACAYVEKQRATLDNVVAVIHLGIVGTDTERGPGKGRPLQIADGGWLNHHCLPYLAHSFGLYAAVTDIVDVAGTGAPLDLRSHAGGPVAAHTVFFYGPVGRPAVSISFFPDPSTETSADTADRLDPTALKRAMFMALGSAYVLATPAQREFTRFGPQVDAYIVRDLGGGLEAFVSRIGVAPADRLVETFYQINARMNKNELRCNLTLESLKTLALPEAEELAMSFESKAKSFYSDMGRAVMFSYFGRVEKERIQDDVREYQRLEAKLNGEIPSMLWHGPVTEELLRRRAPQALPVPNGLDVLTLFGLVDGTRSLFGVWAQHEAMGWIGLPYPLPPAEQLTLPTDTDLTEVIEFLRRCETAGIIRISPKASSRPNPSQEHPAAKGS